jgi:hypothetical protein
MVHPSEKESERSDYGEDQYDGQTDFEGTKHFSTKPGRIFFLAFYLSLCRLQAVWEANDECRNPVMPCVRLLPERQANGE